MFFLHWEAQSRHNTAASVPQVLNCREESHPPVRGLLPCKHSLAHRALPLLPKHNLGSCSPCSPQDTQVPQLFCKAVFYTAIPKHVMLSRVIPSRMQDFALAVADLCKINVSPFLQPVEGPLNNLFLQRNYRSHPAPFSVNWGCWQTYWE